MIPFLLMLQVDQTTFDQPTYFTPVIIALFVLGTVLSLIAAVLGFARARAFGAATRWFACGAVCLLMFHIHILVFGFGVVLQNRSIVFPDRKSTRLNSSHSSISYAVFCLKKNT